MDSAELRLSPKCSQPHGAAASATTACEAEPREDVGGAKEWQHSSTTVIPLESGFLFFNGEIIPFYGRTIQISEIFLFEYYGLIMIKLTICVNDIILHMVIYYGFTRIIDNTGVRSGYDGR